MTGWAGTTMPDHAPRSRHDPPALWDRVRANVLSVRDFVLSIVGGGLIIADALIPDGLWFPSYSLAMIPVWVQIVIAVLLVGGGVVTGVGILVRKIRGITLAPLTSILLERVGWLMLTFGWGTTAAAIVGNGRVGSTLSLVIVSALTAGALAQALIMWGVDRDVRREIHAWKATTDALRRLGGD